MFLRSERIRACAFSNVKKAATNNMWKKSILIWRICKIARKLHSIYLKLIFIFTKVHNSSYWRSPDKCEGSKIKFLLTNKKSK